MHPCPRNCIRILKHVNSVQSVMDKKQSCGHLRAQQGDVGAAGAQLQRLPLLHLQLLGLLEGPGGGFQPC